MKTRSVVLAALGSVFIIGAAAPAFADYDDWRRHERREHQWREHEWRERHEYRPTYYAPPPPVYYAPQPYYYAPPIVGFGINVR